MRSAAVIRGLLRRAVIARNAKLTSMAYRFEGALVSENDRIDAALERGGSRDTKTPFGCARFGFMGPLQSGPGRLATAPSAWQVRLVILPIQELADGEATRLSGCFAGESPK